MDRLRTFPLVYLATPYTMYRDGLDCAFKDAAALAARLLTEGVKVYSPITHCHPMAVYGGLNARDHAVWLPYQESMMRACDVLLVAQLRGWQESFGILHEIKFFAEQGKPVFYLDTVLLRAADRAWEFA